MKLLKKAAKKLFKKVQRELFLISIAGTTLLIFIPIFTYAYFAKDLASATAIMNRNSTGVILYDRNGIEFFKFYDAAYKKSVSIANIPPHVREAVIVAEDREFYSHPGISIKGIIGALIADIKEKDLAYGGSTITQQLVKSSLLKSEKDVLRKYQEIFLAQEIERKYTKDQILEMYLNSVYFGEGAFGIEAASQTYFGKSVKDLKISEASLLAGLIAAPSRYSPISGNREAAIKRQMYVLGELREEKFISEAEYNKASKTKLVFDNKGEGFPYKAPHFALMVRDELIQKYGEELIARSGFRVYTTLDTAWQEYAESAVKQQVDSLRESNVTNGAAVVIDPSNGEVRVAVGSHDWFDNTNGKVNMATTPRQPGSSFKPIIYADALEKRIISPATVLKDQPTTFQKNYKPQNYDKKFRGPVLVRRALANSLNVPAVEVMQKVGVEEGLIFAKKMGISTLKEPVDYGLSLVLGSGEVPLIEMTNAYATFANNGKINDLTIIKKIDDKRGRTIYQREAKELQVIDPEVTFLISSILSDTLTRRETFGTALNIPQTAAVKTGTSEDYRDSLTLGYTPHLAVGVWVGNNDNKAMTKIAGSLGAAPIWKSLMLKFHEDLPDVKFQKPDSILTLSICKTNGLLARTATSSATTEYFLEGTQPTRACSSNNPTKQRERAPIRTRVIITPLVTPVPSVSDNNESRSDLKEMREEWGKERKDEAKELIKEIQQDLQANNN